MVAQSAACSLTLSPTAQVSVYFLMHFLALEEENQPSRVLDLQVDSSCGRLGGTSSSRFHQCADLAAALQG